MLYKTWSGQVSLGAAVEDLLDRYEALGGDDTVQRLIVMDREAHAAWLFKALRDRAWDFIVPLKKSVVSAPDRFSKLTDWAPHGERGDEIRGGRLQLNDSKDRSDPMEVRWWVAAAIAPARSLVRHSRRGRGLLRHRDH